MTRPAAIYARVSSDRQKENHTIASQLAALVEYADSHGYLVPSEWRFQDEGYSGAILLQPGLEALRDLAAAGQIEAVLVFSPDRLSRKYAYQVLLAEELSRCGVELVFLKAPSGTHPGRSTAGAVPGHDRRIRAGADCRAISPWQAPSRAAGLDQCVVGRTVRLPLCEKERHGGGILRSCRVRSCCRTPGIRGLHATRLQYRRDCAHAQRTSDSDQDRDDALGTLYGLGPAAQPGIPGPGMLWQDRASSTPADHAAVAATQRTGQSR